MADDPFAKYQNAFQSIVPPQGVQVAQAPAIAVTPDQVALARYNKFLMEPGRMINPNTIGTATIDRDTGRMIVPGAAQEYAAVNRNNRQNKLEGDLRKAARLSWRRGDAEGALDYEAQVSELNNKRGASYEDRLAYFLAMAQRATPPPRPSANGFS